jgi:hypothetical protein
MGRRWIWGVLCLCAQLVSAAELTLVFKQESAVSQEFSLAQLQQRIPSTELTIDEPHTANRLQQYRGFSFNKLLDEIYGEHWRDSEEVIFHCLDGFQAMIPISYFRKYNTLLAYAMPDRTLFKLSNELAYKKEIELAPFYLVWDTEKNREVRHLDMNFWPYQVNSIELVRHTENSRTHPPKSSSTAVLHGFEAVRRHCLPCHSLNGEGGGKAPELNYPVNITEYFREEWLKRWIDNPAKLRWNVKMPPLQINLKNRPQLIDNIVEYLKVMRDFKQKP